MRAVAVVCLAIGFAALAAAQTELNIADNLGKRFHVAFGRNFNSASDEWILTFASRFAATVTVKFAQTGATETFDLTPDVALQKRYAHSLGYSQTQENVIQNKGVEITSSHEISLAGTTIQQFTTDAYMALPVDVLGTEYVMLSHNKGFVDGAYMQIVGTEDDTLVTINPSTALSGGAHPANTPFNITLNKNQAVMYITGYEQEISGSTVSSTKPVAVFGGYVCANVPDTSVVACDTLVDQMPPVSTLGKSFVLVPYGSRTGGDWIRVLATKPNTQISLNNAVIATLNANQVHSFSLASTNFALLDASEPIMVLQLLKGTSSDQITSDPAMAVVPPISQWSNNYIFSGVGPLPNPQSHWVSVAAPADQIGGVRLDGAAIPANQWDTVFGSQYKAHRRLVTLASHTLNHVQPNIGLQVQVYGFGSADSYAFPGGQRFAALGDFCVPSTPVANDGKDNDCDGRVDEELINGIDDDGDGKIDEDTASTGDVPQCPDTQTVGVPDLGATHEPIQISGNGKCVCLEVVEQP